MPTDACIEIDNRCDWHCHFWGHV